MAPMKKEMVKQQELNRWGVQCLNAWIKEWDEKIRGK